MSSAEGAQQRVVLRRKDGRLDKVKIAPVKAFHAEVWTAEEDGHVTALWLACDLPNGERVTFSIEGRFWFRTVEGDEGP